MGKEKIKSRKLTKKDRTYTAIWLGDYDKDGVPNIDDKYPFNKRKAEFVNPEIRLSKAWKGLLKRRNEYRKDIKTLAKEVGTKTYRTKEMYSIINKQMGRNIIAVQDMGGMIVYCDKRPCIKTKLKQLNKKFPKCSLKRKDNCMLESEDKYKVAFKDKTPYMAHHLIVRYKKKPFEIQIKTKKMSELHEQMHTPYKLGDTKAINKLVKKSRELYKQGY